MLLIFDLDDTLYATTQPFYRMLAATNLIDKTDFAAAYQQFVIYSQQAFLAVQNQKLTLKESHRYRLTKLFAAYQLYPDNTQLDAFQALYASFQGEISLSQELADCLQLLAQQHTLAILTNGPIVGQTNKLNALAIETYCSKDNWFISEALGQAKPALSNFIHVLEHCHTTATQAMMIGDSHHHDIEPAHQLGLQTCWFNRQTDNLSPIASQTVFSEQELINYLYKFHNKQG